MARVHVTSSDVHARLARGECANYRNGCRGQGPCAIVEGGACAYFNQYVKPLLEYGDFALKYGREARMTVALNPKAKVVRQRRRAEEPVLTVTEPTPVAPAKPAKPTATPKTRVEKQTKPTRQVPTPAPEGLTLAQPEPPAKKAPRAAEPRVTPPPMPPSAPLPDIAPMQLVLEITPTPSPKRRASGGLA